jgi:hypothetical protein
MAGRVDGEQFEGAQSQALCVGRLMMGHEGFVLAPVAGRRQADQLRTAAPGERRGQRRVVAVSMGYDHPSNGSARRRQNGFQMARIVGTGIYHGDLSLAQQVSIRSRTCHQTGIAGHDAAHAFSQGDGFAGSKLRSGVQSDASYICNH